MQMGPFNHNYEQVENDALRLQKAPFSDQSVAPLDVSEHTADNLSELRRI